MTIELVRQVFWLLLPAAMANMAPVLFRWLPWGAGPVDFGFRLGQRRILGDHKTWRGLIVGLVAALLTAFGQGSSPVYGVLLGAGALGGDLVKSFFKRRLAIPSGHSWPFFDQADWILGALVVLIFIQPQPALLWLVSLLLFVPLHFLVNVVGYKLGIRSSPW